MSAKLLNAPWTVHVRGRFGDGHKSGAGDQAEEKKPKPEPVFFESVEDVAGCGQ